MKLLSYKVGISIAFRKKEQIKQTIKSMTKCVLREFQFISSSQGQRVRRVHKLHDI